MSYSFAISAASKPLAIAAAEARFDEIVGFQPDHATDKPIAMANVKAALGALGDDDAGVELSASGWIQRSGDRVVGLCANVTVTSKSGA